MEFVNGCRDEYVRERRVSSDDEDVVVKLWGINLAIHHSDGPALKGAIGLSPKQMKLLVQRGAIGDFSTLKGMDSEGKQGFRCIKIIHLLCRPMHDSFSGVVEQHHFSFIQHQPFCYISHSQDSHIWNQHPRLEQTKNRVQKESTDPKLLHTDHTRPNLALRVCGKIMRYCGEIHISLIQASPDPNLPSFSTSHHLTHITLA
ncbi:hypothetical protein BKA57DRAFT_214300 [Linnemannia elongata]|nr:hypothetical protein BKA57DRAFT_214300 [Linnemannia elongata]